jgi:hypothetical protein
MTARVDPDDAGIRRRLRATGWILFAVMIGLAVFAAWFIVLNGRKSRTVLHSELAASVARRIA